MAEYVEREAENYWCERCCNFDKENVGMDTTAICKLTGCLTHCQEYGGNCKGFNVPAADVVEVRHGEKLLPITEAELRHLINDVIAYIWGLEDRGCDKEEFGYFSRKELLEKLQRFEKENFPRFDECTSGG